MMVGRLFKYWEGSFVTFQGRIVELQEDVQNHPTLKPIEVFLYVGVSKNNGTPKWMVYNGKPY